MFYNYFISMGYLFIFFILLTNNIINLSAQTVIAILGALIIATIYYFFKSLLGNDVLCFLILYRYSFSL